MFDVDRSITSSVEDRLGRGVFAKYMARCILDHHDPESFVIGLQGGWGSGKTSLINLTLEEINSAAANMFDYEKPIILNFSPWSYSGQNQLIYGFFRRLSSVIRQFEHLENSADIIHLLELYMSFFTHQPIPKSLRLKRKFADLFKSQHQEAYAWESGLDPIQVKTALNDLLKKQKHKIIIFIDNISRLEPGEINQIFQIVKSMGDYSNTIYVLSFDKTQVINAIDQVHAGEGNEYIQKLVQLPFNVPPISKQDLDNLLLDRLQLVAELAPEGAWNNTYWADIYYSTLKHFFGTCRDITRYVNTLSFSYARVKELVNPVDFFALSAVEVFAPQVFLGVRENKDLFTDLLNNVYLLDAEKIQKDKLRCDEIIARASYEQRSDILKLLIHLFPRLHSIYTPEEIYYHSETLARKNLRVCSPDIFEVYFRMSIPTGDMTTSELETILGLASNEKLFSENLLRLNQDQRVTKFLDLLDGAALQTIPEKSIGNVINALIDSADLFPEGLSTPLSFNTAMRVHRICHQLLRRFKTTEERFTILERAISQANKSLYSIVNELTLQGQEHIENEDTYLPLEHRDLLPEQLAQLRTAAAEKIKFWARISRLSEHPKLLPILKAWKAWGNEEDCRLFVELTLRNEKGLLAFLCATLKDPIDQTMIKLKKNPEWINALGNITQFIPLDTVEPFAKTLFEDDSFEKLQEKEQLALLIFLDLINAQTIKVISKTAD